MARVPNRWAVKIDRVRRENVVSMNYQNEGPWVAYDDYVVLQNSHDRLVEALRAIAAHEPNAGHNHNLNDLIAMEAVRVAVAALEGL